MQSMIWSLRMVYIYADRFMGDVKPLGRSAIAESQDSFLSSTGDCRD
jgi:hypothetical protein